MKKLLPFIFVFLSLSCNMQPALPAVCAIPANLAIRALIGEAGGQSDAELLAHAYTLKNRATLRGVYGLRSKWAKHPDADTFQRAKTAWLVVLADKEDPMGGRTEWRSIYDLKKMALRGHSAYGDGLRDPLQIGDTVFFRKVRR